jgi:hypothetical protein
LAAVGRLKQLALPALSEMPEPELQQVADFVSQPEMASRSRAPFQDPCRFTSTCGQPIRYQVHGPLISKA